MKDEQIVQMYWDRNQEAIQRTAEKYGNYCISIARNILGNQEDAEECVNDTYLKTWESIPTNRPQLLATFLGKITRNLSFNRYKREHADKRGRSEIPAILDELSECVSGRQSVEEEIQYKELVRTLNEFLDSLPEHKRNIFVRRYWYSECVATIAKAYGMRENAVSMLLGRLRLRLQQYLTERGMQYDK